MVVESATERHEVVRIVRVKETSAYPTASDGRQPPILLPRPHDIHGREDATAYIRRQTAANTLRVTSINMSQEQQPVVIKDGESTAGTAFTDVLT